MAGTFADAWNSAYEAIPADNENINLGANRIRDLKVAVRQRIAIDHSISGDANDGKHNQVTLRTSSIAPTLDTGDGCLFTLAVGGNTELFYEDSAARTLQITKQGIVQAPPSVPSGSVMLFAQAAAPTGWTQDTSKNDVLAYITNNSAIQGGSFGGSGWSISGLVASTSVAGHTLSQAEIPQHTHFVNAVTAAGGNIGFQAGNNIFLQQTAILSDGGSVSGGSHTHGASTSVFGDATWRPPVLGVIVCVKQ